VAPFIHDPFIMLGTEKIDIVAELLNSRGVTFGGHRQFRVSGK
jgi:hypothetical protein